MKDNNDVKIEDYIESEDFYNFIHETCYEAIVSSRKVINLPLDDEIKLYLVNFFFHYNFAYVTLETATLKDDVTIEVLEDAYQTELLKVKEVKEVKQARESSSRNHSGHISSRSNRLPRIGYGRPQIYKPVPKNDHRIESFCDIRYGKIRVDNDDVASTEKGETRKLKK